MSYLTFESLSVTTQPVLCDSAWAENIIYKKNKIHTRRWRDDVQKNICFSQKKTAKINSSSKNSV